MKAGSSVRRAASVRREGVIAMLVPHRRLLAVLAIAVLCVAGAFAKKITVKVGGTGVEVEVPDDFASLVESRLPEIEATLAKNNKTKADVEKAMGKVNEVYGTLRENGFTTDRPFTVVQNGLDDFASDLRPAIANAQTQQNVWAEAWIGNLVPGFHFGAGVNVGVSSMNINALKDAALALGIDDAGDVPDKLVFPTITADLRLGGIILPFDVGFNAMKVNTSSLGRFSADIEPVGFDFFTIGGDVRWALIKGTSFLHPRVSVGAGAYYTKGFVSVSDDTAEAKLDFSATTFMLNTQASAKILFLVPFVGARALFAKTSVDWNVKADWSKILTNGNGDDLLSQATSWGLLPGRFSGGSSGFAVYPQVFAGLGLDLFVLNLTVSGSYDIVSQILSAAVSVRIAW